MGSSATPGDGEAVDDLVKQVLRTVTDVSGSGNPRSPESVVEFAARALPHSHHSGLTLLRPTKAPATIAASDPLPREVDALQYSLGEGPCLDAATGPAVLLSDDIGVDERWPRFGPRCASSLGVRSMLSLRLPVGGDDFAGINFYSREVAAFTVADVNVGAVIIPVAALAVESYMREHDYENLSRALESNRQISTAIGILMVTHKISDEAAFALLRKTSMDLNRKLAHVADEVKLTGALPEKPSS